jgi:uncharacterized membrane protein (DUF373 family)
MCQVCGATGGEKWILHNGGMADEATPLDLGDGEPAGLAPAATADGDHRPAALRSLTGPAVRRWISVLEHAQDIVGVTVGVVLVLLAAVLLVSGVVDFVDGADGSISRAAPQLLDRVLLVLILVEIVHTVVLSLRAHRLIAQPFIVVGLIAVIRFILVVLTPGGQGASAAELGLLIGMVAVFVAGLIAVTIFEKGADRDGGDTRV